MSASRTWSWNLKTFYRFRFEVTRTRDQRCTFTLVKTSAKKAGRRRDDLNSQSRENTDNLQVEASR